MKLNNSTSSIGQKTKIDKKNFSKMALFSKKTFKNLLVVGACLFGMSEFGWARPSAQEINTGPGMKADLDWQKLLEASREADVIFEGKIQEVLIAPMGFDMAAMPLAMLTFENMAPVKGELPREKNFPHRYYSKTPHFNRGDKVMVALKKIGKSGRLEIQAMAMTGVTKKQQLKELLGV